MDNALNPDSLNAGFVMTGIIGVFFLIILMQFGRVRFLRHSMDKMKKSFNDLDEQAKLIVQTDLELNKTQEELDKRLGGLDALQKISRLISTTLDENEIFSLLEQALITNLEFEKNLILIYNDKQVLNNRVTIGFSKENIPILIPELEKETNIMDALHRGQVLSSINCPKERREAIVGIFSTGQFVIAPILAQKGVIGFVLVGNQSNAAAITEGDEEIISILASLIGQTLENARSFEEVFRSQQILEAKVHDRTKQLESALEEVQSINKIKSEFMSAVSHELRTPLTSIKGYASILMQGKLGDVPQQVKERLGKINAHSDKLVNLINGLLDISRIESKRVEMKMSACDLSDIIESVHDLLTLQMKAKNINWEANIDKAIPKMLLDESQVERIFINLIGNAIKFTPEKGTISANACFNDDSVAVEVSDTGIGISKDDIAHLFDEFYRVDNKINQSVEGTGLGLPLAKKIVEAHGGRMWITSKINQGTTFHFTLPIKNPNENKKDKPGKAS